MRLAANRPPVPPSLACAVAWLRGLRTEQRAHGADEAMAPDHSRTAKGSTCAGSVATQYDSMTVQPGELAMTTTVKATYANGVFKPTEPLDIEEGREVTLSIEDAATSKRGLAGIVEAVQELHRAIPPDAWDVLPTDGAKNYKHYLYGHPKKDA
ncbi:MAG: antitoxin family protein [Chloroflexi bacterium]|nr:antitoxin family protein [Chloroflexota bacterium]